MSNFMIILLKKTLCYFRKCFSVYYSKSLKKQFVIGDLPSNEQKLEPILEKKCWKAIAFSDFKYLDETNNVVKKIDYYFLQYFYLGILPYVGYLSLNTKINKCQDSDNSLKIKSSGLKNDWCYLVYDNELPENYTINFKLELFSFFKEIQVAFRHKSLFERLRFRIVDNRYATFEVVTRGIFFNSLYKVPCILDLNKRYDFKVVLNRNYYQFLIDNKSIIKIDNKFLSKANGGMAIVFWDDKDTSNINVKISNLLLFK